MSPFPVKIEMVSQMDSPFVREALFQERVNGKARCLACQRNRTLSPGCQGWCCLRENRNGKKEAGLEFVYIGNLTGHRYDNTYCPDCHAMLIRRMGFDVLHNQVSVGRCPVCGRVIAGVWSF